MGLKKAGSAGVLVALFGSFALMLYGEWSVSIGLMGLIGKVCLGFGFFLFGLSLVGVFAIIALNRANKGSRTFDGSAVVRLARQTAAFLAAVVVYGGAAFVSIAMLAGLADASPGKAPIALCVMAVCIAIAVLYRRYRKKHPVKYDMLGALGLALFGVALIVGSVLVASVTAKDAIVDLVRGPQTDLCWLAEVDEDVATGRGSALRQDTLELTFRTLDERDIFIEVAENDRDGLTDVTAAEGVVWLTYYPASGVYVSAEPGMDDYLAAGGN